MKTYGKITGIKEITNFELGNYAPKDGKNGAQLGMSSMINSLYGGRSMDGYEVTCANHRVLVLIDNGQSCCESWGYMSSEDNLSQFVGATLRDIKLTDTGCNTKMIEEEKSIYEGGIQFVDFITSKGDFQLAVYNAHNGYYGHGIIIAIDDEILCQDTL